MLDSDTRARLEAVMNRALHDGVNLFDALDQAKLIVTEDRIKEQWAVCLERLWQNLDAQPTTALMQLGGGQHTPMDVHRGVLEYIDIYAKQFAAQAKDQP